MYKVVDALNAPIYMYLAHHSCYTAMYGIAMCARFGENYRGGAKRNGKAPMRDGRDIFTQQQPMQTMLSVLNVGNDLGSFIVCVHCAFVSYTTMQ